MEITIDGSSFDFRTDYQDDAALRASLDALAQRVFSISFEPWYRDGGWSDRFRPYSLLSDGVVVANISVSPMDLSILGQVYHCVQLGTVMTSPELRGRGLVHFLMARVLTDWVDKCDAVYLYANDTVQDFYPKFGFAPVRECRHSLPAAADGQRHGVRRLIPGINRDRALLLSRYALSNPFSLLTSEHNPGLVQYYWLGPMRTCFYYIEQYEAVAAAEYDGEILYCHDIFCPPNVTIQQVLTALAHPETTKAVLGFTPRDGASCSVRPLRDKNETLFMLNGKKDLFQGRQFRFPRLSHA